MEADERAYRDILHVHPKILDACPVVAKVSVGGVVLADIWRDGIQSPRTV